MLHCVLTDETEVYGLPALIEKLKRIVRLDKCNQSLCWASLSIKQLLSTSTYDNASYDCL